MTLLMANRKKEMHFLDESAKLSKETVFNKENKKHADF
jgi:hypothetical protein